MKKNAGKYALIAAKALLCLLFLMAGVSKLVMSPEQMAGPVALPIGFLRFIGICETLGALGLVLPGLFKVKRFLTPLAAAGLAIIMIGATVVSVMSGAGAGAAFPLAVGVICALIARFSERRDPQARHVVVLAAIL